MPVVKGGFGFGFGQVYIVFIDQKLCFFFGCIE